MLHRGITCEINEAAARLRDIESIQENMFPRVPVVPDLAPAENLLVDEVGIFDLINAFQKILKRLDKKPENLREIFEENYTVSDKIDFLLKVTASGVSMKFEELFVDVASRAEIVVTFLAMLELAKHGSLTLSQDEIFGTIQINRVEGAEAYVPGEGPELTE